MKGKLLSGGLALTAVLLAACGQQKSASSTKNEMKMSVTSDIATMDPSHASDTTSMQMLENTGEGFLQLGKNSKIEKELATKISVSKDQLTYTFDLRHDAKWGDGKALTAKDFVYGWQRTIDPKTASEYAYLYSGIKNADKIMNKQAPASSLGIKANGKYQVVVTLEHPISYFKLLTAMPTFYPQEQSAVAKYGKKYGTTAATSPANGPFKLAGWNGTNSSWKLVKNSQYWDKKNVKLSTVTFQTVKTPATGLNLYKSGKLDQTALVGTQVAANKSSKDFVLNKQASMTYVQFNMKKPSSDLLKKAFNNVNIRKAMSLALNRKQFVKSVLADGSIAPKGFVTTDLAANPKTGEDFAKEAYVASGVGYNKAEAKKLYQKGLKEIGATKLSFELMADDDEATKSVVEFIQGQWKSTLGADVTIRTVPKATRIQKSSDGDFDVTLSGWGADFSDPVTFLNLYQTGNSGDAGGYTDATYDKLIDQINNSTGSAEDRWNLMVKAEKKLMTDQVTIPLYQKSVANLQSQKIKNLIVNTAGPLHNYKGVYLSK
jgi:oligopeptide transport system substrate-binding protein